MGVVSVDDAGNGHIAGFEGRGEYREHGGHLHFQNLVCILVFLADGEGVLAIVFNAGYVRFGYKAVYEDGLCKVFVKKGDGAEEILRFEDRPALPIDFINPNFACSQDPKSGFRTRLSMVIMTPEENRKNLVSSGTVTEAETSVISLKDPDGNLISERTIDNRTELAKALLEEFGVKYDT